MTDNYAKIVSDNHKRLFDSLSISLESDLPAHREENDYVFSAFGETCRITNEKFYLSNDQQTGVVGILLSLYALNAKSESCVLEPFKAYKEFPGTMPYVGAFTTHTENILLPYVRPIKLKIQSIAGSLNGFVPERPVSGDFSFVVYPLPKLALCYIFYEADDDFPASVTCLYSCNASLFMPNDALADVGEYTSKKIIQIIKD
ncbi:MAG: DUF3786 domain-containing protein [Desulfobacteraceae bacterium]|jgi:hypothetical protein